MLTIFLMTRNETKLLEDWIKYHGYLFGLENLHILDGSHEPRIFEIFERYEPLGLNVHYTTAGLNDLAVELTQLMHEHKGDNDFLIKLDTDEFLAYTSPFTIASRGPASRMLERNYIGLERQRGGAKKRAIDFLVDRKHGGRHIRVDNIRQMFSQLPVNGQRYKASFTVWSLPTQQTLSAPVRNLTSFTPLQFTHIKSFFHSASFVSVDLGCHNGESTGNRSFIDTGLTLVHYHAMSVDDSMRSAREVLLSHAYIDIEDSLDEQRRKLRNLKPGTARFASFHKANLYLRHLEHLSNNEAIEPTSLYDDKPFFRQSGKPIELTLVRETLNKIDRTGAFESTR